MSAARLAIRALQLRFDRVVGSQLKLNIVSGLGANILSALITVVGYRLYLNYLGYERYGLWLILSTVLIMVQLGNFGISPALLKLVAEDFANHDIAGVYRYITSAVFALSLGGALLVCVIWLFRSPIVALFGLKGESYLIVYSMLPYLSCVSVYVIMIDALNAALGGLGRYDLVNYSQTASQVVSLCVTLIGLQMGWSLWSFVAGNAAAYVFLNIVSLVLIRSITRSGRLSDIAVDQKRLVRLLKFGSWVFSGSVVGMLVNPINRVLISRFIGVSAIPIYDIAYTGTMKIRNFLEIGFRPLLPALSSLQASGSEAIHQRLVSAEKAGSRFILYWGTALHVIMFIGAEWALKLWLGPRFSPALPPAFRIMLVGAYCSLWAVQAYYTLLAFGRSMHVLMCFVIQLALDVGAIYLIAFLHRGGPMSTADVATGASIGLAGVTLYLRWQSRRLRTEYRENCEAVTLK
ncbi:MAG: polysaccharide biosynthesis protein [Bryobacterales bacterium]|nr:polysaccharide biosynthesis protein [Bryobacterales bacterium]